MASLSSATFGISVSVVILLGYLLYRATLPKPIPGIPYGAASIRPFGDTFDFLQHIGKTQEFVSFLTKRILELESPIVQVFVQPFSKPWVVLADTVEAQAIMGRRTNEFDRSDFFADLFVTVVPHNQVVLKTGHQWRQNRSVMAPTMTPQFLQSVAGPQIYNQFSQLVELWRVKARMAKCHPFAAAEDIQAVMLDAIFCAAFGEASGCIKAQAALLSGLSQIESLCPDSNSEALFPHASWPAVAEAFTILTTSTEIPANSPLGKWHHLFAVTFFPTLRRALRYVPRSGFRASDGTLETRAGGRAGQCLDYKDSLSVLLGLMHLRKGSNDFSMRVLKDRFIRRKLSEAWENFTRAEASEDEIKCAADLIVEREVTLAKKQNRSPQHDSPMIQDELLGFLQAGHDTTATTIEWGVKLLCEHSQVQQKLRDSLRAAFPDAVARGEAPSATQISTAHIPYLDAVVEEILRCGGTAATIIRVAMQDTDVLGYPIPKGTEVFMLTLGPSSTAPPLPFDNSKRSKSGKQLAPEERWTGSWNPDTLGEFNPDRWLMSKSGAEPDFDPQAGPMQMFGGGLRGCFGRRLAHLALRIAFTLIVWNFDMQPLPEKMSDFDAKDVLTHRPKQVYLRLRAMPGLS